MATLILEKDDYIRESLSQALDMLGQEPIKTSTNQEVMEQIKKTKPRVVLIDVSSEKDGVEELIQSIRRIYKDNPPKIVIMTTMLNADKLKTYLNVDDILYKPFDLDVLEKILH